MRSLLNAVPPIGVQVAPPSEVLNRPTTGPPSWLLLVTPVPA